MDIKCVICKAVKTESEFVKGTQRRRCKACQRRLSKDHYKRNKSTYFHNGQKRRNEGKKIIDIYLSLHPCVDCGEKDIEVLDFDHREDKRFPVSRS